MMKKKKKSSSESLPPSFLSLPYDIVFNTLARISRTNYPILSLVSKRFRSLLASPDLDAARSLVGRPEKYLHVCLNLNNNNNNNPNPSWFILSQRKLIPTPSFPYRHLKSSSVVSTGTETYVIGGGLVVNGSKKRSERVFLIDCKTHQWRKLPNMRLPRKEAVVEVMDGKIFVIGGCSGKYSTKDENYGEVYDPNTQTWEPTSATTLDLPNHTKQQHDTSSTRPSSVETENNLWLGAIVRNGELRCGVWFRWSKVVGLEAISSNYLISVTNSCHDKSVVVWWKTNYAEECKTEIWCAQILIEICDPMKIRGFIEWSQSVFTFQGCHDSDELLLHSALVTHDF
ncbi:putative F-box/kelch-repeat protein At2g44030 [Raphanus sativus]|uniref:F-box/kelch-repeat protein At2g44030 n=1 Tax=Raphanus sativus TaxID=3726 RepID=A0A9W3CMP1_RAPSA|nr:putative F-box/kelch-repeat protein At2g44030 [Raphanus sativus]XP_056854848.1 putative F-box/kelch-repeat protein At2g44030 [Raphanus sativus]